jgi:exonuclease VII small subunit
MTLNAFLDKFQTDLDNVINALEFMFQQISSSLNIDASDSEYLEESMRKSQEVPEALQQSSEMIDDSLSNLEKTEQAIAKLKDDLKAEKERLRRLMHHNKALIAVRATPIPKPINPTQVPNLRLHGGTHF